MIAMSSVFSLLCLSFSVLAKRNVPTGRPYELSVQRDLEDRRCTHLILQNAQVFRALSDEGYYQHIKTALGEEIIKYIADDEDRVWARAEALCGERSTWDFHALIHRHSDVSPEGQVVMGVEPQEESIPLEIEPLITSGDSNNRVDLVFFADGCMCT